MKSIAIVGRLPAISFAELESLLGADKVMPFGTNSMLIDLDTADIPFDRLGGTIRLARILTPLDANNWRDVETYLLKTAREHAHYVSGKLILGLSVFGFDVKKEQVARTALALKKAIKATGKSVRMVPHSDIELGSASVLHNKLTGPNGWELLIVSDGKTTYLAQTTNIQNIEAYAARDQARPKRDARVGMLPPKLAQTIINLATGQIRDQGLVNSKLGDAVSDSHLPNTNPQAPTILDPFCGTGVILQEALLMGYTVYGSDLESRMIDYAQENLDWLALRSHKNFNAHLGVGDATSHDWKLQTTNYKLVVASETYLGPPLHALPDPEKFRQIVHDISRLHNKFLQNIGSQLKPGARLCLAIPAWRTNTGFVHLSTLDKLKELGYTRIEFKFVSSDQLIYHRDGQVVARELVVLTKD